MHRDNLVEADRISKWRKAPENKEREDHAKGDDRFPPWTWKSYLYHDGEVVTIPSENLTAMCGRGGVNFKPGSGKKTLKSAAASKILWQSDYPLLVNGNPIPVQAIDRIDGFFLDQAEQVEKLGFVLFAKRAKIGQGTKHVRVRPKFLTGWSLEAEATLTDPETIGKEKFREILEFCGFNVGLGDWRPGAPRSPGKYGQFEVAEIKKIR
jgi:hypothetical protein